MTIYSVSTWAGQEHYFRSRKAAEDYRERRAREIGYPVCCVNFGITDSSQLNYWTHCDDIDPETEFLEKLKKSNLDYETKALIYAERYGVYEYKVKGNKMIWYDSSPAEQCTCKSVVNLDTLHEGRHELKRYHKINSYIGDVQVIDMCH